MVTTLRVSDRAEYTLTDKLNNALIYALDDEALNLQLLEVMFAGSGATLRLFEEPEDMFEQLNNETPTVFILDVMMHGMDGWQVFSKIRSQRKLQHIPILFVTCLFSMHEERLLNRNHTRTRVMAKPYDRPRLYKVLDDLLNPVG